MIGAILFLATTITLQWGTPCGGDLAQGSPVPSSQPKAQVQLHIVKNTNGSCQTTVDVGPGSYVFAIWFGQSPTTGVLQESNRVGAVVSPTGVVTPDHGPLPSPPTGLRIQ